MSHDAKKTFHKTSIERLRKDYDSAQKQLEVLLDMRLQQSNTQNEYDKKACVLKQRQIEIEISLKEHTEADAKFAVTVSTLLELAARASELFERSKVDQKRRSISFALSNLVLRGKELHFTLKKPFDAIVEANKRSNWLPSLNVNLTTLNSLIRLFGDPRWLDAQRQMLREVRGLAA